VSQANAIDDCSQSFMPDKNGTEQEMHLVGLNARFEPNFFTFGPISGLHLDGVV